MNIGDIVVYKNDCDEMIGMITFVHNKEDNTFRFTPCAKSRFGSDFYTVTKNDVREATYNEKLEYIKENYLQKIGYNGQITNIHCIGDYQIIESIRNDSVEFRGYINFKSTNVSYFSLDAALIGCVCMKYDGPDSMADIYFSRMIGIELG